MKVDLESEVTVWFKHKGTFVNIKLSLDRLLDYTKEDLIEILESKYSDCKCTNESQNHCECEPLFEDAEIDFIEVF